MSDKTKEASYRLHQLKQMQGKVNYLKSCTLYTVGEEEAFLIRFASSGSRCGLRGFVNGYHREGVFMEGVFVTAEGTYITPFPSAKLIVRENRELTTDKGDFMYLPEELKTKVTEITSAHHKKEILAIAEDYISKELSKINAVLQPIKDKKKESIDSWKKTLSK